MAWEIKKMLKKLPKLNNPVLIEGLPGIGNIGKVAVDFMVDELGAKKLFEFHSYSFPHSVFVGEDNLVELPTIEVYYKKFGKNKNNAGNGVRNNGRDLLLLVGDVQPMDEESSYEFSNKLLDLLSDLEGDEIITIGGIGLPAVPENPKIYCTGNSKEAIKKYKNGVKVSDNLFGVVGPIVGVTGLLVGLAQKRDIKGVCFLAETYSNPLYLGMKGSQEILKVLNKKLSLRLNLKKLDKEIEEVEAEIMKRTQLLGNISKKKSKKIKGDDASYIG